MSDRSTGERDESDSWDGETRVVYSTTNTRESGTDLSVAVVESLAEAKGQTPIDIEQPLYDVVDPDALDQLFTDRESTAVAGRVVFEFDDHEVTVHSDGDILVYPVARSKLIRRTA